MTLIVVCDCYTPRDSEMFWALFLFKLVSALLKTVVEGKLDYLD